MKHRDGILDLIRGLSALLVMLMHLRGFLFVDFGEQRSVGMVGKLFYFTTGLGHQAVMVFFVLSGYFVGGSVLSGLKKGKFKWSSYAAARLIRLWLVLVPALFLTFGIDSLGAVWNPRAYVGGLHGKFFSGPTIGQPAAHDAVALLGNLSFLQTISVPVYGTNGPLWSLANEFWYYVMFPLLAVSFSLLVSGRKRWLAVLQIALFGLLVWWLPRQLVIGGLIWVMGAGVWWMLREMENGKQEVKGATQQGDTGTERGFYSVSPYQFFSTSIFTRVLWHFRGKPWRTAGGILFICALAASKTGHWMGSDLMVGGVFAVWILSLTGPWRRTGWWIRVITALSEISFTLYVVHFPVLFFFAAVIMKGRQFSLGAAGFLWFGGLAAVILAISAGMWWLFERNTGWIRKYFWGR